MPDPLWPEGYKKDLLEDTSSGDAHAHAHAHSHALACMQACTRSLARTHARTHACGLVDARTCAHKRGVNRRGRCVQRNPEP